jgi:hypothetical protein
MREQRTHPTEISSYAGATANDRGITLRGKCAGQKDSEEK